MKIGNILKLPDGIPEKELFEKLAQGNNVLIERIVSYGHKTPDDYWYDQNKDELVILLQGEAVILFDDEEEINLKSGDYLLIPKHKKHRVEKTSSPCIWLAVHANL
ncbi:MAG TPA: cupin domain-containing protein [Candidatus Gastranaerophilales bacterium]|nr:cupin domain-containing protein [Candidatus Gastranaerophilales bacterium]